MEMIEMHGFLKNLTEKGLYVPWFSNFGNTLNLLYVTQK